jgi:uncharacterized surface protein with fasciclin (FAS1) repeats
MNQSQSQNKSLASLTRSISKDPHGLDYFDMANAGNPEISFDILNTLLFASSLDQLLREKSTFTLLAPTDQAFGKLPQGKIDYLLQGRHIDCLVSLLSYHIVTTRISSTSLATTSVNTTTIGKEAIAITVQGKWISMHSTRGDQLVDASVVGDDIKSANGVIIPINAVVTPLDSKVFQD